MGRIDEFQDIIINTLSEYTDLTYVNTSAKNEGIYDTLNHRYLVMSVGWDEKKRTHGCLIHIDLIDDKVWVQKDNTEDGIALELEKNGIPKEYIVLGFQEPSVRPYTGYAIS